MNTQQGVFIMKKIGLMLLSVLISMALFGCGQEKSDDTTTITVEKSGKIVGSIVEDFDKEYYSEDELKEMIASDIAKFNNSSDGESVKLNSISVSDGVAKTTLTYKDAESYAGFNDVILFEGTVAEAYNAGYSFDDVTLKSATEDGVTLDKSGILAEGSMHIVITDENEKIKTYKNIAYISSNVTLVNKKEAAVAETEEPVTYILFK